MQKKAIIHLLTKARIESGLFTAEIDAIQELSEKYWIKNVLFYKLDVIKTEVFVPKLDNLNIFYKSYLNKKDLKKQVLEFSKNYEIIFISSQLELLVNVANEIKWFLWTPLSDIPDIFRNKFLQRELIQQHNPELWIKFIKWLPENLNIQEIEEKVWYPFMMKPVDWVQSSWAAKITCRDEFYNYIETYNDFHDRLEIRWVDNKELIVEEFIDWKMYSIDYFVTSHWEIRISKPVKVRLWIDFEVDDYCNIARIISQKTEWEFKWIWLKTFVNLTVKATWIRNTFVHHEFKINSKWVLKTIELNGRIGGWRIELLKRAYDFNLYELLLNSNVKPWKLKQNSMDISIYATKRWILTWFNEEIFKKIEGRESVFDIIYVRSFIWKEIWLTKDWFIKAWCIKLRNKDYDILSKDFNYIKSKYKELLIIKITK